jgi:hypothetical protein
VVDGFGNGNQSLFFREIDGYAREFSNQIANWGTSQSEATNRNKPATDVNRNGDFVLK